MYASRRRSASPQFTVTTIVPGLAGQSVANPAPGGEPRKRIGEDLAAFPDESCQRAGVARRETGDQVSLTTMSSNVLLQTFMRKAACDNWV